MFSLAEKKQLLLLISNFHNQKKKIPYLEDLKNHPVFGASFYKMDTDKLKEVEAIIHEYIHTSVQELSSKWGELFRRVYAMNKDMFYEFRWYNSSSEYIETKEFQSLWKHFEKEFFKYEWILTSSMSKRSYGIDKVVTAFYDIVHAYFPYFSSIQ